MAADPSPLAVLFADISGSTSLYEKLGNEQALRMVNACLGGMIAVLGKHGGGVVKTIGDEIVARFDSADQALQAASAMQVALRVQAESAPQLAVKIGFSFGPVIEQDQDIFGDTVNLASRIAGMANPGQILTTHQTVDALAPFLRSTCRKLYTTNVKGKVEKISVFEVMWHQDKGITVMGGAVSAEPLALASLKLAYRAKDWLLDEARDALSAGRDPSNDIVVAGNKVSRHHARFFLRQGKYIVADESANGTWVQMEQRAAMVHREEYVLTGRGRIGLGQSVVDAGEDALSYEIQ